MQEETLIQSGGSLDEAAAASRDGRPEVEGYELQRRLGAGSFGEVWMAVQKSTGQSVAIKFFSDATRTRLDSIRRELERLRDASDHPGVVGLIDANLDHPTPYFVMPMLPRSLAQEPEPPTPAQLEDWLRQLALALRHSHEKGMLHCDLKPSNVMLDDSNLLRLVDFGQSCEQGDGVVSWGTLGFMAPEQASLGSEEAFTSPSVRWDVYGLGATFYRLLTGHCPYWTEAELARLAELPLAERLPAYREGIQKGRLRPLIGVDRDLADILTACLNPDPERRTAGMGTILEDLQRRRLGQPLLCRRPWSWGYRLAKLARRPTVVVATLAAVALVTGGSYSYLRLSRANQEQNELITDLFEQRAAFAQEAGKTEEAPQWWLAALDRRPQDLDLRVRLGQPRFARVDVSDQYDSWLEPWPTGSALLWLGRGLEIWENGRHQAVPDYRNGDQVAPAPDGRSLALVGNGGVRIWSRTDARVVAAWKLAGEVSAVGWDGDDLVVVLSGEVVRWSRGGKELGRRKLPPAPQGVWLSRDGRWIRTFGEQGAALVSVRDGSVRPLSGETAAGHDWFSPDSRWVLGQAELLSLTGEPSWRLRPGSFGCFVGPRRVAMLHGRQVHLEAPGGDFEVLDHPAAVRAAQASADGRYLLTWTVNDRLWLWDCHSGRALTNKPLAHKYGATFGFTSDASHFFGCDSEQKHVWRLDPWLPDWTATAATGWDEFWEIPQGLLAIGPDGWRTMDSQGRTLGEGAWPLRAGGVALSPDGSVAVDLGGGIRRMQGLPTELKGDEVARYDPDKVNLECRQRLAYSPQGTLAVALPDRLRVGQSEFPLPEGPLALAWSPDGRRLAVLTDQRLLEIEPDSGRRTDLVQLEYAGPPCQVAYPGGQLLARSGGRLWTRQQQVQLEEGFDPDLDWALGGDLLLVALDNRVQRYRLPQLQPLGAPVGYPGKITHLGADPGGRFWLISGTSGTVLWDYDAVAPLESIVPVDSAVRSRIDLEEGHLFLLEAGLTRFALPVTRESPEQVRRRWEAATGYRLLDLRRLTPLRASNR